MSRVLSLALKITGDASGVRLTPVERALKRLGEETDKVGKVFDKFAKDSDAGSRAQAQFANESQRLTESLKSGAINGREYAEQFAKLAESANKEAAALERAAQLTAKFEPEAAKFARTQAELNEQVSKGRITQEVYNAAIESAAKNLTGAERAAAGLAARTADVAKSGERSTLQFRELSGIFAVLPGSLGNIAGRISGITSASEGLSRIFSGGLQQGAASLVRSFAGLVNPLTAGVGALVAFGAAARNVATGLIALEDRVERLGNTADKLGISFEFVQVLEDAAKRSGTSIDAVSVAFGRLQKSILSTDEESKAAQKALSSLRIEFEDLQRLSPEEQYRLIGERLAAIENPARRTATATALFGRAGAELLPFFRNLPKAASDLETVGAALNDQQRARVDRFGDAMDRLATASQGAGQQLREAFTDIGTLIAQNLADATGAVAKFLQQQNSLNRQASELTKLRRDIASVQAGPITQAQEAAIRAGQTAEQVLARARGVAEELKEELESPADPAFLKSLDDIAKKVEDAKAKSVEFGQAGFDAAVQYERAIAELKQQFDSGLFNEETLRRQARVVDETFNKQIAAAKQLADESRRTTEEAKQRADAEIAATQAVIDKTLERIRIEQQFDGDSARAENASELSRVRDEIGKVFGEIANATRTFDREGARRAQARLATLQKVEAKLVDIDKEFADRADEIAQGFAEGFDKAFAASARGLDPLIEKASRFGNEGARAAQELQRGIDELQRKVRDGVLGKAAYEADLAAQRQLFAERIQQLDEIARREQQQREAAFNAQVAANNRLQEVLNAQVPERIAAAAGIAALERQKLAAENLAAIENQIALTRRGLEAAREQGDRKNAAARVNELKFLEDLAKAERAIIDGKAADRQDQRKLLDEQAKASQELFKQEQSRQQQLRQQQQRAQEERARAAAEEADRQEKRIRALNSIGQQSISTGDLRSSQGASQFVQAAAGAFDPNLAQQRAQTKLLQKIVENSGALQYLERGIGQSVRILRGGA